MFSVKIFQEIDNRTTFQQNQFSKPVFYDIEVAFQTADTLFLVQIEKLTSEYGGFLLQITE